LTKTYFAASSGYSARWRNKFYGWVPGSDPFALHKSLLINCVTSSVIIQPLNNFVLKFW